MESRIVSLMQFVMIASAFKLHAVSSVPMKYEIGYRNSIDLDAEQTEARYDQGMLSDIMNDERAEMQKAESCVADNFKYDHGQKIQRHDPCEICLCIDGEIFCWWKQCDIPARFELGGNPLSASNTQFSTAPTQPHLSTPAPSLTSPPKPAPVPVSPSSSSVALAASKVTTSSAATAAIVVPPYPDQQPDTSVRVLHPQPAPAVENIPQNILSFPQTPPIMMYRPVMAAKNGSTGSERNKHGAGLLKKVKPLHLNNGAGFGGKKPYRKPKSKAKGYAVNYGRLDGSHRGLDQEEEVVGVMLTVTERIASDGEGPDRRIPAGELSHDRFSAFDRPEGRRSSGEERGEEDDDSSDDDDSDEGSEEAGERSEAGTGSKSFNGNEFGGYGFGMIKDPEEDKQQHYIITSSGHVEMFDDNSMEATENAFFGINRLAGQPQQPQLPPLGVTTSQPVVPVLKGTLDEQYQQSQATSSSSAHDPLGDSGASNSGGPIPPIITMTTNVTQHSNYSSNQQRLLLQTDVVSGAVADSSPPLTPYAPLSSGSIIDVLNSTVDGDYLDDNQTELIYPAVPGLTGGSGKSGSSSQVKTMSTTTTTTTTSSATSSSSSSSSSALADGRSSPEQHCVVMGVSYKVGAVLKQETGNCLHCVCVAGPENDPVPRVTCTPLNCPPLILPDILDGAGF